MELKCVCGYEWDYRGEHPKYATCPRCLSKLSIRRARERYFENGGVDEKEDAEGRAKVKGKYV